MNEKLEAVIDDELVDEIVDDVLASMKKGEKSVGVDALKSGNSNEISRLQERIINLENRVGKYINNFKANAPDRVRYISEVERNLSEEKKQQIIHLQGQIEDLRTAMIRLSNEVKRMKEI